MSRRSATSSERLRGVLGFINVGRSAPLDVRARRGGATVLMLDPSFRIRDVSGSWSRLESHRVALRQTFGVFNSSRKRHGRVTKPPLPRHPRLSYSRPKLL